MHSSSPRGFGVVAKILAIPLAVIVALVLVVIFYEVRKMYWDGQVKNMCAKDGGVEVYERVSLSREEFDRLGGFQGQLPIPLARDSKESGYPYFREDLQTRIRERNPEIVRLETTIRRSNGGKPLGKSVYYYRRGGDLPSGLFHDSSFGCPSDSNLSEAIFEIAGGAN